MKSKFYLIVCPLAALVFFIFFTVPFGTELMKMLASHTPDEMPVSTGAYVFVISLYLIMGWGPVVALTTASINEARKPVKI